MASHVPRCSRSRRPQGFYLISQG